MKIASFNPAALDPRGVSRRRNFVLALTIAITAPAAYVMADVHWLSGYTGWKALHWLVFVILFGLVAFGATQAIIGLIVRRRGGDTWSILNSVDFGSDTDPLHVPVAVVMPICNEEVKRVIEGWRTIFLSVAATKQLPNCDFFLLSDSTNPNTWVDEETAWFATARELNAEGRMFYRRRRVGINKKAGNIADFCRRWGKHYRYMVVLDADSIMSGEAIVKLVRLMERNRRVGLVQGVPLLVNGETILARLQQFATRLYGPVFSTGLNFWQLGEANYWGHNAIIRLAPFMRHCQLPELPGDGPFGGRILSHDYVEAALMRRAGWQVWLATDMEGNYEECPANLIDFAKRDRRWLQGNLQHLKLIFARGFHPVNRIHFSLGILSYLASPLWLLFLILSTIIAWRGAGTLEQASVFPDLTSPAVPTELKILTSCLFGYTVALLLLPKVIALLDVGARPQEVQQFGGWRKLTLSVITETVVFTLLAPILMLFHTKFIVLTLCRKSIGWGAQRRGRDGRSAWGEAFSAHVDQTVVGIVGAFLAYRISPGLAAWMSPVLAGLILSIPLSYLTGSLELGLWARQKGLFLTPLETAPEKEVVTVAENAAGNDPLPLPDELLNDAGLIRATVDPYVNAIHVGLLRAKEEKSGEIGARLDAARAKLLREGPQRVSPREKLALLSDVDSMVRLHEEIWLRPARELPEAWRRALEVYAPTNTQPPAVELAA